MVDYEMSVYCPGTVNHWEKCNAVTEVGAKRECTSAFGHYYVESELLLAIKHKDGQRQTIAKKKSFENWRNV